jgi:tRNA A37 threonylcarbamoyltransferase TsaD
VVVDEDHFEGHRAAQRRDDFVKQAQYVALFVEGGHDDG